MAPLLPPVIEPYFFAQREQRNVPQHFIKSAVWVPYRRGYEGTPGYFTQLYHDNPRSLYLVEFNFDLVSWVDVRYSNSNSKWIAYRLTNFDTLCLTEEE